MIIAILIMCKNRTNLMEWWSFDEIMEHVRYSDNDDLEEGKDALTEDETNSEPMTNDNSG